MARAAEVEAETETRLAHDAKVEAETQALLAQEATALMEKQRDEAQTVKNDSSMNCNVSYSSCEYSSCYEKLF